MNPVDDNLPAPDPILDGPNSPALGTAEDTEGLLAERAAAVAAEQAVRAPSPAEIALKDVLAESGSAKPDPILMADNVSRRFGGLVAVDVKHLEVQRGTITALIGPNGAGKSTFFNQVSGFDKPTSGTWSFNGRTLQGRQRTG